MAITFQGTVSGTGGGRSVSASKTVSADSLRWMEVSVADGETFTTSYLFDIDVSQTVFVAMSSSQDVTTQINGGGGAVAELEMVAGRPIVWMTGDAGSNPLGGSDITSFEFTNSSGSSATVKVLVGVDPTV